MARTGLNLGPLRLEGEELSKLGLVLVVESAKISVLDCLAGSIHGYLCWSGPNLAGCECDISSV